MSRDQSQVPSVSHQLSNGHGEHIDSGGGGGRQGANGVHFNRTEQYHMPSYVYDK